MNRSSFLVKAAALTSSLLLVATFVAVRAEVLDVPRTPASEPTTVDPQGRPAGCALGLEFDFVGESVPGRRADTFSGTGVNDHDWVKGPDRHRQNHAPIQVSAEALQLVDDELRTRTSEKPDAAMMSGSKTFIIPWKLRWEGSSGPLVAGDRTALATMTGTKPTTMDWNPITMFSDEADPLISVVNPDPSTFEKATTPSVRQSKRVQPGR